MTRAKGRKRGLTDEERRLWSRVTESANPLEAPKRNSGRQATNPDHAPGLPEAPAFGSPGSERPADRAAALLRSTRFAQAASNDPRTSKAAPAPPAHLTGIDRRTGQRLRRGRVEIDERIDLHGLTQARAHAELRQRLAAARDRGARTVLVITGKGSPEGARFDPESMFGSSRGILRRLVPEWLSGPDLRFLVTGYTEAHPRHGGSGALYVRLKRAKG